MGNICANANLQAQQCTSTVDTFKNTLQYTATLGDTASVSLIQGHYRQHRAQSLLVICQLKNLQHCDPLRDYSVQPDKTIDLINNMRKNIHKANVNKNCPYKKLSICIAPQYRSQERQQYMQQIKNVFRQAFEGTKQVAVELLNTIEGIHTLPNQLILGVLLGEVQEKGVRLQLISTEKKMINMYRYQLSKREGCVIRSNQ